MTSTFCSTMETLDWRGMLIQISYNSRWLPSQDLAHLELETLEPIHAPLPVTETGYRSHFVRHELVEQAGGAAAYVVAWLNEAAKSKGWAVIESEYRQLALF